MTPPDPPVSVNDPATTENLTLPRARRQRRRGPPSPPAVARSLPEKGEIWLAHPVVPTRRKRRRVEKVGGTVVRIRHDAPPVKLVLTVVGYRV